MKQIRIIALFIVLVFFPLGSWFYLQKGLDFRKELGKELVVKGEVSDFMESPTGFDLLNGKTSLIILPQANIDAKQLDEIYDQFKQAYTFQLINAKRSLDNSPFANDKEWINQNLISTHVDLKDKAAVIVDKEMGVRNYFGSSDKELQSLVRQLSISFPKRPSRDIVEKKDIKSNE